MTKKRKLTPREVVNQQITINGIRQEAQTFKDQSGYYRSLGLGGLQNPISGTGTYQDKSRFSFYLPTSIPSRDPLEVIYIESWACKRFINIFIDSMFQKERIFENEDENRIKAYEKYTKCINLNSKIARVMKAGRLYGTAFLVFLTKENDVMEPLNLSLLQKGDLYDILIYDRYSVSYTTFDSEYYTIAPRYSGKTFTIHKSRVLRIDGISPLVSDGFAQYNPLYGVSEIIPIFQSIVQSDQIQNFTTQLMSEASIPIFKVKGYRDALSAKSSGYINEHGGDCVSMEQYALETSRNKSIYNSLFMDVTDEFSRQEVNLSGIAQVLDRYSDRLAAAVGVPATIFLGQSPDGMNATGESDLKIYADRVASKQNQELRRAYTFCDQILMRTSGNLLNIEYNFPSLIDTSESVQAETLDQKAQAITQLVVNSIITIPEARSALDGDPILGQLSDQQDDFAKELQKAKEAQNDVKPRFIDKTFRPPKSAQNNAKKVLEWKKKHKSRVKGMTSIGWARARQLASGKPISLQTVKRMSAFNRHKKNSKVDPKFKNEPWRDRGYVAWLGWGGSTGMSWAKRVSEANS